MYPVLPAMKLLLPGSALLTKNILKKIYAQNNVRRAQIDARAMRKETRGVNKSQMDQCEHIFHVIAHHPARARALHVV